MIKLKLALYFSIFSLLRAQTASEAIHTIQNEIGFGARALSMGGSYTALADDPSAMYWNPAGLASIKSGSIYTESFNMFYNKETSFLDKSFSNPLRVDRLNGIGATIPIPTVRGSLVIAIGLNRLLHYDAINSFSGFSVQDNSLEFPITTDGNKKYYQFSKNVNRDEKISSTGSLTMGTLAFGLAVSPETSVGLSFSRISGGEVYKFKFTQIDAQNNYSQFPADFNQYELFQSLETKISAIQIRGGIKSIIYPFMVGLSFSLPYTLKIKENHGTEELLFFDNTDSSYAAEFGYYDYKIDAPMVLNVGTALVVDNLALSISGRLQNWSAVQFDLSPTLDSADYSMLLDENNYLQFDYRSTFQIRAGVEYLLQFNKKFGISLRSGFAFIPSPTKYGKGDRSLASYGIGIPLYRNFLLDAAFVRGQMEKKSSDIYTPSGTVESINTGNIFINLSYLFDY